MTPVDLYKCLSDETRLLATLLIYKEGEACVCELVEALACSQPKLSRHLAHLRQSGLLIGKRQGQWVFYSINPDINGWIIQVLEQTYEGNQQDLRDPRKRLNEMVNRPDRCSYC